MTQLSFTFHPQPHDTRPSGAAVPPSRVTDPDTSRRAARRHAGRAETNRARVLALVRLYTGRSSWELSQLCDLDRHEIARRLPELEREGRVTRRMDARTGKFIESENGVAWWPTDTTKN